jgi:hypothetical protein
LQIRLTVGESVSATAMAVRPCYNHASKARDGVAVLMVMC